MRQSIVDITHGDDGQLRCYFNVDVPEPVPSSGRPSESQLSSIRLFFGAAVGEIAAANQAHALLCWRDYAQVAVAVCMPTVDGAEARVMAAFVAGYISFHEYLSLEIVGFMDDQMKLGVRGDALKERIRSSALIELSRTFLFAVGSDIVDFMEEQSDLFGQQAPSWMMSPSSSIPSRGR